MHYIGIDVSVKESAICILDGRGKIVREIKVPTDPEIINRFCDRARLVKGLCPASRAMLLSVVGVAAT